MADRKRVPQLPPPPPANQQSRFADILSGLTDFISNLNPFTSAANLPQGSFNERFTRTPGIVVPSLPPGVDAQYVPYSGYPGEGWGKIMIKPDSDSNTISHEAAHSLYDQAGLYKWGPALAEKMNPLVSKMVTSSYQGAIAQDPSALTSEGLGYAMNAPVPADETYVNYVASRISDPVLQQRLLALFQHAKAMSARDWAAEKERLRTQSPKSSVNK